MKPKFPFFAGASLLFALGFGGPAVTYAEDDSAAVPATSDAAEQLEQLVAPIALYPDALVALILPAATQSSDVVLAARFLNNGGDLGQVQTQSWDDSVKGLAHYPDVVKWMDTNLEWTRQIGDAYLEDAAEVMAAIQRARKRAQDNGVLTSTPQQQVLVEEGYVRIIPAQPDVIYVPRYDPQIIYVERIYLRPDPWLTFGIGFGVGAWLNYDCDWRRRVIVVNPHHRFRWQHHRDWHHHRFVGRPHFDHGWRTWAPAPGRPRPHRGHFDRGHHRFVRPSPIAEAPRFDHHQRGNLHDRRDSDVRNGSRFGLPRRESHEGRVRRDLRATIPNSDGNAVAAGPAVRTEDRSASDRRAVQSQDRRQQRSFGERNRAGRPPTSNRPERADGRPAVVNAPRVVTAAPVVGAPTPRVQPQPQVDSQRARFRQDERGRSSAPVMRATPQIAQQPRVQQARPPASEVRRPAVASAQRIAQPAPVARQEREAPQHGRSGHRDNRGREN